MSAFWSPYKIGLVFGFPNWHSVGIGLVLVWKFSESGITSRWGRTYPQPCCRRGQSRCKCKRSPQRRVLYKWLTEAEQTAVWHCWGEAAAGPSTDHALESRVFKLLGRADEDRLVIVILFVCVSAAGALRHVRCALDAPLAVILCLCLSHCHSLCRCHAVVRLPCL